MTDHSNEALSCAFKYEFLRIVDDHEHYYALNLPFGIEDTDLSIAQLSERHPLAMILLNETISTLKFGDKEACTAAVTALYEIIVKTAFNAKVQAEKKVHFCVPWFIRLRLVSQAFLDSDNLDSSCASS